MAKKPTVQCRVLHMGTTDESARQTAHCSSNHHEFARQSAHCSSNRHEFARQTAHYYLNQYEFARQSAHRCHCLHRLHFLSILLPLLAFPPAITRMLTATLSTGSTCPRLVAALPTRPLARPSAVFMSWTLIWRPRGNVHGRPLHLFTVAHRLCISFSHG